jgi:hypothetical protein
VELDEDEKQKIAQRLVHEAREQVVSTWSAPVGC